jgi:DNA polymerase I-like protein with 3'-5' exonuclease and polymerase domains
MRLIFDIETDGLLDTMTVIHSLVLRDADTGALVASCSDSDENLPSVAYGLGTLSGADEIIGHNVIRFDIPAIQKLYPGWAYRGRVIDTLMLARLWKTGDVLRIEDAERPGGTLPGRMFGAQSLEAWGMRFGVLKGGYSDWFKEQCAAKGVPYNDGDEWREWCPEMQDYCEQDTVVTLRLWQEVQHLLVEAPRAAELEHRVAWIIARQERRGFAFDSAGADALVQMLMGVRAELEDELRRTFKPWWRKVGGKAGEFVPARDNRKMGYTAGCPITKVELAVFDPNSRQDFASRLKALYGWEPTEKTESGLPKIDEATLGTLPWPEARLAARYFTVQKRLGQLATGKEAWLSKVRNGRIHGSVNTNGAHTGRMTHQGPNMAQVPSVRAPWGKECRALFMAGEGYVLVGMDAAAIELRNLAGYMAPYDGGAYVKLVLSSDDPEVKAAGGDLHSVNARALGLDPKKKYSIDGKTPTGRDIAKVWFYAFIYGAGAVKLGEILGVRGSADKMARAGRRARDNFMRALPALAKLVEKVQAMLKARGYLKGLDGRHLHARSPHAALNTLLQSAGAVLMKQALVELDDALQAAGLVPGVDYEFVANVHDEVQMEVLPQHAEFVGKLAADCVRLAGEAFNFKCPLAGNYVVGKTWADTH